MEIFTKNGGAINNLFLGTVGTISLGVYSLSKKFMMDRYIKWG